jgi:hypothetical protein
MLYTEYHNTKRSARGEEKKPAQTSLRWVQPSFAGRAKSCCISLPVLRRVFFRCCTTLLHHRRAVLSPGSLRSFPPSWLLRPPDRSKKPRKQPLRAVLRAWGRESYHPRCQNRSERQSDGQRKRIRRPRRPAPPVPRTIRARGHAPGQLCAARSAPVGTGLLCACRSPRGPVRRERGGRTGSLASCPRSMQQLSAAGRKQMQLIKAALVSRVRPDPVPPAAVALVPTGWRVASSVFRCFCACAASVGGCWFSRLVRCLASRCYWLRRGAAGPARRGCCRCWCWCLCGCCSPRAGGLPRPGCWCCLCPGRLCCLVGVVRPSGAAGGAGAPPRCGAPPPVVVGRCLVGLCCFWSAGRRCCGGNERGAPPGRSTVRLPGQIPPRSCRQGYRR